MTKDEGMRGARRYILNEAERRLEEGKPVFILISFKDEKEEVIGKKFRRSDIVAHISFSGTPQDITHQISYSLRNLNQAQQACLLNAFYFVGLEWNAEKRTEALFNLSVSELLKVRKEWINFKAGIFDGGDKKEFKDNKKNKEGK